MSSGLLASKALIINTNTALYTVPAGRVLAANVSLCNRGDVVAKVRLALVLGSVSSLDTGDYIEYDAELQPNGVLERTGIILGAHQTIVARSNTSDVSAGAWGYERDEVT